MNAIAAHMGVKLDNSDWQTLGHDIPLIVNMQPSGKYLGEDFHRAGGVAAVIRTLLDADALPCADAMTVTGKTIQDEYSNAKVSNANVILSYESPLKAHAGFLDLKSNLWDSAIMKTSVISDSFRQSYLSNPDDPEAFEGNVYVFDGPEHYHELIDNPSLEMDERSILVMRGAGPIGFPGGAEVVNMQPPAYLIARGITELPCIGDGRQSGTSGSPSILNVAPEAAVMGGLSIVQTGDRLRVDLRKRRVDLLVSDEQIKQRKQALSESGGYTFPEDQTPWQKIQRSMVSQFDHGMVLDSAPDFQRIAQTKGVPRNNH